MPIRPQHRWLYPVDWPQLSALVRFGRAAGRCEGCGRPHGRTVVHLGDGRWWDSAAGSWRCGAGKRVRLRALPACEGIGPPGFTTRVVLAAAHRNHDPTDNAPANAAHMPSAHRHYAEWTPARFERWGREIGPETETLVIAILHGRPHPEQGFRTCLGVLRLFRGLALARAEAVSARATAIGAFTYKSIANNLDKTAQKTETPKIIDHPNLRGAGYFH